MLAADSTCVLAQEHLARLYSLEQGVGTAWLDVLPCKHQWELDDATVKSALRFMLGVSPGPPLQEFYQCPCGYKGSDSHHDMTCDKLAGSRTMRHNHIHSMAKYGSSAAGHSSSIELQERHLKNLRVRDVGYAQRGDVLVSTLDDLVNVDITVTHPASATMRSRASVDPGAAAKAAEANKHLVHACEGTSGYRFVPFAVGSEAIALLNEWATSAASGRFYNRNAYLVWIQRELSVALIKGNAPLFKRSVGFLTQGIGRRMVHGGELTACVV
jgi:hypothetical protein